MAKELTPRSEDYSQWYNDLVIKADLAENSAVRGCMVIKPYGYAISLFIAEDNYLLIPICYYSFSIAKIILFDFL